MSPLCLKRDEPGASAGEPRYRTVRPAGVIVPPQHIGSQVMTSRRSLWVRRRWEQPPMRSLRTSSRFSFRPGLSSTCPRHWATQIGRRPALSAPPNIPAPQFSTTPRTATSGGLSFTATPTSRRRSHHSEAKPGPFVGLRGPRLDSHRSPAANPASRKTRLLKASPAPEPRVQYLVGEGY